MKRTSSRGVSRDPLLAIYDGHCCWPNCTATTEEIDAPLCGRHLLKAWRIVRDAGELLVEQAAERATPQPRDAGVVYFLRFSDRIKIGWSQDLPQRLTQIPHDEVLHAQPGSIQDERRCHAAFAHLRESGEWFRAEPDLLAFIDDLRRQAS